MSITVKFALCTVCIVRPIYPLGVEESPGYLPVTVAYSIGVDIVITLASLTGSL